ncbi:MAG TPA: biopolymer transporter ExbD [Fimbriiglobus sp.]|jgi:biopolymer transport protein ExbD
MFGKRKKRRFGRPIEPDLPITPMLDMSFQLLFYFIVTFRVTPTEAQIPLSLPNEQGGPSAAIPSILDDEPEEVIVQVTATDAGGIGAITLRTGRAVADAEKLGADAHVLFTRLQSLAKSAGQKGSKLRLEMGDTLNYQYVIVLIDDARRAGFERVSPVLLKQKP